jgi:hypothetical protein
VEHVFLYPGGLVDFVKHLNHTRTRCTRRSSSSPTRVSGSGTPAARGGCSSRVAMQWSDAYSESVYTFANTINTHEGGTHEEGFRTALTRIVNDWARSKGHNQGEGAQPGGLRHPRGPDRHHQHQDRQPAVRGADQDQAGQLRGQGLRAAGDARVAQGLVRPQPRRRAR